MRVSKAIAAASLVAAFALSGCGGGGSVTPHMPATATPTQAPTSKARSVTVKFSITVPSKTTSSTNRAHPQYISSNTKSATISVTPTSADGPSTATVNCTSTCVGTIAAPVGTDTFSASLYQGTNGTGNLLSSGSAPQTITAGIANVVSLTFNPVVHSVSLVLSSTSIAAGTAAAPTVTAVALDPSGATIVAPGNFQDAAGDPLTIAITKADDLGGYTGANPGSTTLGTSSFTAPPAVVTATYNGGNLLTTKFSATVTGAAPPITVPDATLTITPTVSEFSTASVGAAQPAGIVTFGSNLWIGTRITSGFDTFAPPAGMASPTLTAYSASMMAVPVFAAVGHDGNVWYSDWGGGGSNPSTVPTNASIDTVTPVGAVTQNLITSAAVPIRVAAGPGPGNLIWFAERGFLGTVVPMGAVSAVGSISTDGLATLHEYSVPGNPYGIVAGPDGNMWFTEDSGDNIGVISQAGVLLHEYPATPAGMGDADALKGITVGPDGNLWVCEYLDQKVISITTSGVLGTPVILPAGSGPRNIITGPDGRLWFTEIDGNEIGAVKPDGTGLTQYPLPAGTGPVDLTIGPDGNVWFTETSGASTGVGRVII